MAYTEQLAKRADSLSAGGVYDFSPLDAFVAPAYDGLIFIRTMHGLTR